RRSEMLATVMKEESRPARPAPTAPTTVRVEGLHKRYGRVQALSGVSLGASAGEILGVLGPNGAGKTTLIEILEGLRAPDLRRARAGARGVAGLGRAAAAGAGEDPPPPRHRHAKDRPAAAPDRRGAAAHLRCVLSPTGGAG